MFLHVLGEHQDHLSHGAVGDFFTFHVVIMDLILPTLREVSNQFGQEMALSLDQVQDGINRALPKIQLLSPGFIFFCFSHK